jgi:hypothetical protein
LFLVGACTSEAFTTLPPSEASRVRDNPQLVVAMQNVARFREKLLDAGVHPDRFALWLATVPEGHQVMMVRIAAGDIPGLMGAKPGTKEAELLAASRMSAGEVSQHRAERRQAAQLVATPGHPKQVAAANTVQPYRERLADRGIHPERFAVWLALQPPSEQEAIVRVAAGLAPGMLGARPGTIDSELMMAAVMSPDERAAHEKGKRKGGVE